VRSGAVFTAGLTACLGLLACGGSEGANALRRAADKTRSAPYLVVSQGAHELFLSRRLTVIKERARVVTWTATTEEFTWRANKRCYQRSTEFNRDDVRQQRENVAPRQLGAVHSSERNGIRVLTGRTEESTDSPDTEYELRLDSSGRLAVVRQRSARFGVLPPGRWSTAKYRYPSAERFALAAGPAPRPRCR
jgi:hypothetical protein